MRLIFALLLAATACGSCGEDVPIDSPVPAEAVDAAIAEWIDPLHVLNS